MNDERVNQGRATAYDYFRSFLLFLLMLTGAVITYWSFAQGLVNNGLLFGESERTVAWRTFGEALLRTVWFRPFEASTEWQALSFIAVAISGLLLDAFLALRLSNALSAVDENTPVATRRSET